MAINNYMCLIARPKSLLKHPPKLSQSYLNPNTVPNESWFKQQGKVVEKIRVSVEDLNHYKLDDESTDSKVLAQ